MAEHPLVLSDEEQQYLITHLKSTLEETRVESHHTRTSAYREQVRREEAPLRGPLAKPVSSGSCKPNRYHRKSKLTQGLKATFVSSQ
jgi:hypothetical protein